MPKPYRSYDCEVCGQFTRRRRSYDKSNVCLECGVLVAGEYALALASRTGPQWEAHKRNPGGRPRKDGP